MRDAASGSIAFPRPAATVVLVREAQPGPEVLMLRRASTAAFMPDAWVFPGGALDPADASEEVLAHFDGPDEAAACARLGLADVGRAWFVAAIRECFEECGLLLAVDAAGRAVVPQASHELQRWRSDVLARPVAFAELCRRLHVRLAGHDLAYFGHWITPEGLPRRFDTRFFVAAAPPGQEPSLNGDELRSVSWIGPRVALDRADAGELVLRTATRSTLEELAGFSRAAALLEHARGRRDVFTHRPTMRPRRSE